MKTDSNKGMLVVLSGPSGSGKNTILDGLMALDPDIKASVSATTRKPRSNEIDGKSYYFLSEEAFEQKIKSDEFIEYVKYGDNYYGTLKSEIDKLVEEGKTAVLIIEVRGAAKIINRFPDVISIFLVVPSEETLEERIRKRAEETEECIRKRLDIAKKELECRNDYKYVVVNDVLDEAVKNIYDIIQTERGNINAQS